MSYINTKSVRELELEKYIAEKEAIRDVINAEVDCLKEELNNIINERANRIKNDLYQQYFNLVQTLVTLGNEVPHDLISKLTDTDREHFGLSKVETPKIAEPAKIMEIPGNQELVQKVQKIIGNHNIDEVTTYTWWLLNYEIPVVMQPIRTEFVNPRVPCDHSRFATKLSELQTFIPIDAIREIGYHPRKNCNETKYIADAYVSEIAQLFRNNQDKSTSKALKNITNLIFIGSLIRLTIQKLITDDRTAPTMLNIINNENPYEIHMNRRNEKRFSVEGASNSAPKRTRGDPENRY